MIELTDEMVVAFEEAYDDVGITGGNTRAGLAAVLAIVERDYSIGRRAPARCGATGFDGITCQRSPGHDGHHAWSLDGELVKW